MGVVKANPIEYAERYGQTLKRALELPPFVKEIQPPQGVVLAADSNGNPTHVYELEGDVYALNLVDLEREGLLEYRYLLKQVKSSEDSNNNNNNNNAVSLRNNSVNQVLNDLIRLFSSEQQQKQQQQQQPERTDSNNSQKSNDDNKKLTLDEAERLLTLTTQRLGKDLTDDELREFFQTVEIDDEGQIEKKEFKRVFEKLLKQI